MAVDNKTVEANGKKIVLPNNLKRKSPGKRPMPNFSSHGKAAEKTITAMKIVINQRTMCNFHDAPATLPGIRFYSRRL